MNYEILINNEKKLDYKYYEEFVLPNLVTDEMNTVVKGVMLEKEAYDAWLKFKEFMSNYSVSIEIAKGFVSNELQSELYNEAVCIYGETEAAKRVLKPGENEIELGLSLECMVYKNASWKTLADDNDEDVKFIYEMLHYFGFILRYPKGCSEFSEILINPSYIRYVGPSLAFKLYDLNMTLDCYTKALENEQQRVR